MSQKSIFDIDVTGRVSAKGSQILGEAHEYYATAIIMRLGFDVSVSSVKGGSYDLLITAYENGVGSKEYIWGAQVKNWGN